MSLSIEIVSDVVCPWCFLGHARLRTALAERPDLDVRVRFTPFLLDPGIPKEGRDLRAHLARRYGVDPERMFARVEAAARASGIPLDFRKIERFPSTLPAHVVLDAAAAKGTQPALAQAIFSAYFLEGRDPSSPDVLDAIATAHGFSPGEAAALSTNEDERARIRTIAMEQVNRGVTGVPFFVLGGRHALSGAQEPATWARVFDELAPKSTASA